MDKFRSRNFNLVLYDEDESHRNALDYIEKNCDYAMILHDMDTNETGEIKKPHYHVVLRFPNAKWSTSLANDLGIAENYIEECRSLKRSLLYLIHYYDEDKYQYDIDDVKGSLKNRLIEILQNGDKTENEKMKEIITYIDSVCDVIEYSCFIRYFVANGYTDVVRRDWVIIKCLIDEHNNHYRYNNKIGNIFDKSIYQVDVDDFFNTHRS